MPAQGAYMVRPVSCCSLNPFHRRFTWQLSKFSAAPKLARGNSRSTADKLKPKLDVDFRDLSSMSFHHSYGVGRLARSSRISNNASKYLRYL